MDKSMEKFLTRKEDSSIRAWRRKACDRDVWRAFVREAKAHIELEDGACALREEGGWHTTRHNRHERWPVLVKLDLLEDVVVNDDEEQDTSQDSSSLDQSADPNTGTLGRGHFYLPLDSDDQLMAGSADSQLTAADGQLMRQRRAATLPARGTSDRLMPGYQHIRSYSESKADEECPSGDSR
ncbi:uncharacterized protein LOC120354100 [Nilaparvata lugens]|uniref:uncharacterized protein LOC120354100 n=1 Tax=Nilaparvata lugens TaxID=108931 RepID=UPI00193D4944|nr:uncharacterized protein LOC120354100 [Nilaparvata lugens]